MRERAEPRSAHPVGVASLPVQQGAPRTRARSCRLDGHEPGEPIMVDVGHAWHVRATVHCRRCGAYITSFEGPMRAVQRLATSVSMHGLRSVPV